MLTPEEFQRELILLGLSGREFRPTCYANSLGSYLSVKINVCVFPDVMYPELTRRLALSRKLGELCYSKMPPTAVILVPASLPPITRTLTIYHELGHLAAGDPLKLPGLSDGDQYLECPDRRLAREAPFMEEYRREQEADVRARYALIAGSLGSDSPYAQRMYDTL